MATPARRLHWALLLSGACHGVFLALTLAPNAARSEPAPAPDRWTDPSSGQATELLPAELFAASEPAGAAPDAPAPAVPGAVPTDLDATPPLTARPATGPASPDDDLAPPPPSKAKIVPPKPDPAKPDRPGSDPKPDRPVTKPDRADPKPAQADPKPDGKVARKPADQADPRPDGKADAKPGKKDDARAEKKPDQDEDEKKPDDRADLAKSDTRADDAKKIATGHDDDEDDDEAEPERGRRHRHHRRLPFDPRRLRARPLAGLRPMPLPPPPRPASPASSAASPPRPASAAGSATPSGPEGATMGQAGPVTVRDLGQAFTRAIAPAGQPDKAWAALPAGPAGMLEVALSISAEGKLEEVTPLTKEPPEQLVKLVKQVQALLRSGFFAIRGPDPSAGRQVVRLRATTSDVPTDVPGGAAALSFTYEAGKGTATFTQASGRRVAVSVEMVRVEAAR